MSNTPSNFGGWGGPQADKSSDPTAANQGISGLQNTGNVMGTSDVPIGQFLGTGGYNPESSTVTYGNNLDANAYNAGQYQQGQQLLGNAAPVINQAGGNAYNASINGSMGIGGISGANAAAGLAHETALGKGPQISSLNAGIQAQYGQNLAQNLNASAALASSSRGGGPGLAAAQAGAAQQFGQQSQAAAQGASIAQAQGDAGLMSNAVNQYGQLSLGAGGLAAQGQQQAWQMAGAQANQQAAQNALNQGGLLSSEGMGQAQELAQLQANENAYANNLGLAGTSAQIGAQSQGQGLAAAGSAINAIGSAAAAA